MKKAASKKSKSMSRLSAKWLHPKLPADLGKALAASPKSQAQWDNITAIARRDWILWLNTAKQAKTRTRRIKKTCDMLTSGKRRICCFGGLNWLVKNGELK
jgi:uncharacterized protein YdeI (YjbR/CyaY-like superfamily)